MQSQIGAVDFLGFDLFNDIVCFISLVSDLIFVTSIILTLGKISHVEEASAQEVLI